MGEGASVEVVKLCLAIDEYAVDFYSQLADSFESQEIKAFWTEMSKAEKIHLEYWRSLQSAAKEAGLPEVFEEPDLVIRELKATVAAARQMAKKSNRSSNLTDAFLAAYKLELYMLHPAFASLFHALYSLVGGENPELLYESHLDGLIEMTARYAHANPELEILGGALRRLWKQNRSLASQALTDSLTGILTRRAFLNTAEHLARLAKRREDDLALIMFDVDDFKVINDQLGHQQGDVVLRSVAGIIRSNVRASDLVGRYGGEEFIVLLYGAGLTAACRIAERIREAISQIITQGDRITVSAGAAAGRVRNNAASELNGFIKMADQRLLAAKRAGKNRVEPQSAL